MNSLKNICMVVVLSAILYGAYVTLSGGGKQPVDDTTWDNAMQIELPGGMAPPPPVLGAPTTASSPGAAPSFVPMAEPSLGASSVYPTNPPAGGLAASSPPPSVHGPAPESSAPPYVAPGVGQPAGDHAPSTYPRTEFADAAFDAARIRDSAVTTASYPTAANSNPAANAQVTQAGGVASSGELQFAKAMEVVQAMLAQNQLKDALLALSEWYDDPQISDQQFQQIVGLLDQLAGTVIYSRQHLLEPAYMTQPDDSLDRIARAYNVSPELLAKINGLSDPQHLRPGMELKVVRGPFDAIVDLEDGQLTLFLHGRYAGRFAFGPATDRPLPDGQYLVRAKTGAAPAAAYPSYGTTERWIDLGNQLGIGEGAANPADPRSAIRLSPADMSDVYDILTEGSRVRVR